MIKADVFYFYSTFIHYYYLTVNLFIQVKPSINLGHIWSSSCLQKIIYRSSIYNFPSGYTSRTPSPGPSCLWPGWGGQCTWPSRPGSSAPSPEDYSLPSQWSGLRSRELNLCAQHLENHKTQYHKAQHSTYPRLSEGSIFLLGPPAWFRKTKTYFLLYITFIK